VSEEEESAAEQEEEVQSAAALPKQQPAMATAAEKAKHADRDSLEFLQAEAEHSWSRLSRSAEFELAKVQANVPEGVPPLVHRCVNHAMNGMHLLMRMLHSGGDGAPLNKDDFLACLRLVLQYTPKRFVFTMVDEYYGCNVLSWLAEKNERRVWKAFDHDVLAELLKHVETTPVAEQLDLWRDIRAALLQREPEYDPQRYTHESGRSAVLVAWSNGRYQLAAELIKLSERVHENGAPIPEGLNLLSHKNEADMGALALVLHQLHPPSVKGVINADLQCHPDQLPSKEVLGPAATAEEIIKTAPLQAFHPAHSALLKALLDCKPYSTALLSLHPKLSVAANTPQRAPIIVDENSVLLSELQQLQRQHCSCLSVLEHHSLQVCIHAADDVDSHGVAINERVLTRQQLARSPDGALLQVHEESTLHKALVHQALEEDKKIALEEEKKMDETKTFRCCQCEEVFYEGSYHARCECFTAEGVQNHRIAGLDIDLSSCAQLYWCAQCVAKEASEEVRRELRHKQMELLQQYPKDAMSSYYLMDLVDQQRRLGIIQAGSHHRLEHKLLLVGWPDKEANIAAALHKNTAKPAAPPAAAKPKPAAATQPAPAAAAPTPAAERDRHARAVAEAQQSAQALEDVRMYESQQPVARPGSAHCEWAGCRNIVHAECCGTMLCANHLPATAHNCTHGAQAQKLEVSQQQQQHQQASPQQPV